MAPRLKGTPLQLALRASQTRLGAAALRRVAFAEYGMDALLALPPEQLEVLDYEPRPIAAGAPRQWNDQRLGAPDPRPGRCSTRALTAAFEAGDTRPSEVLEHVYARVDAGELGTVAYSPFICEDRERARVDAAEADARYQAGEARGPLDGVPVPIKDEVHLRGLPTHGGTAFLSEPHDADGFAARALFAGGAVISGKTHTTEWGMSPVGINPNHPMPRNAHVPNHAGGGSSTGTAAAVALGLATVGLGSDGGGSIRLPACLQGVFGLKPSFQRVGRSGDVFGTGSVSVLGPIGQSTSDMVDFLTVAGAKRDDEDYACAYAPAGSPPIDAWELALGRGVSGARIGVPDAEWADADPQIATLCFDLLRALEKDGAKLVDVDLPHAHVAQQIGVLSIGPETEAHVADYAHLRAQWGAELVLQMAMLGTLGAHEYLTAARARAALRRSTAKAMHGLDVLALPTTPITAPRYSVDETGMGVADDDGTRRICRYAFLANLTGYPAGQVPVGTVHGLPAGMQFVGDAWDEASVIAFMAHAERLGATDLPSPTGYASLLGG